MNLNTKKELNEYCSALEKALQDLEATSAYMHMRAYVAEKALAVHKVQLDIPKLEQDLINTVDASKDNMAQEFKNGYTGVEIFKTNLCNTAQHLPTRVKAVEDNLPI